MDFPNSLSVKVVVFDFDGVLVESNDIKHRAFHQVFRGFDQYDEIMKYHYAHHAVNRYQKFDHIAHNIMGLKEAINLKEGWIQEFNGLTHEAIVACPFVEGAIELLEFLKGKVVLYLASATPVKELNQVLKERNLLTYFRGIFGSPIDKAKILLSLREEHSLKKEEMLFIGDSKDDLKASIQSETPFIGRVSDYSFKDVLAFKNCKEIKTYLEKEGVQ